MYGHSREVLSFSMLKGTARDNLKSICVKIEVRTRSSRAVDRFVEEEEEEKEDEICDFSKFRKSLTWYSYITLEVFLDTAGPREHSSGPKKA